MCWILCKYIRTTINNSLHLKVHVIDSLNIFNRSYFNWIFHLLHRRHCVILIIMCALASTFLSMIRTIFTIFKWYDLVFFLKHPSIVILCLSQPPMFRLLLRCNKQVQVIRVTKLWKMESLVKTNTRPTPPPHRPNDTADPGGSW